MQKPLFQILLILRSVPYIPPGASILNRTLTSHIACIPEGHIPELVREASEQNPSEGWGRPLSISPIQHRMSCWEQLPGCLVVLEVLLRGEHSPLQGNEAALIIVRALNQIQFLRATKTAESSSLLACISVLGTIRKFLLLDSQPSTTRSTCLLADKFGSVFHSIVMGDVQQQEVADHTITTASAAHAIDVSETTNSINQPHSFPGNPHTSLQQVQLDASKQQLSRLFLLTYVQVRNKHLRSVHGGMLPVHELGCPDQQHLEWYGQSLMLEAGMYTDMHPCAAGNHPMIHAEHERKVTMAWERYAFHCIDSRLLPGCCNLGCTVLAGVSESSLPTQLCSGCRRMRFCSNMCQRKAWCVGGHALVCGKERI